MFERFTKEARRIVVSAVDTAAELGVDKVGLPHLLLSLSDTADGIATRILADCGITTTSLRAAVAVRKRRAGLTEEEIAALRSVGIDAEEVFHRIEEAFGPDALEQPIPEPRRRRGRLGSPFAPESRKVLELSLREAIALRHRSIGAEHILLALLRAGVPGPMGVLLASHNVTYDNVKQRILAALADAA